MGIKGKSCFSPFKLIEISPLSSFSRNTTWAACHFSVLRGALIFTQSNFLLRRKNPEIRIIIDALFTLPSHAIWKWLQVEKIKILQRRNYITVYTISTQTHIHTHSWGSSYDTARPISLQAPPGEYLPPTNQHKHHPSINTEPGINTPLWVVIMRTKHGTLKPPAKESLNKCNFDRKKSLDHLLHIIKRRNGFRISHGTVYGKNYLSTAHLYLVRLPGDAVVLHV